MQLPLPTRSSDPIDVLVGRNIRIHRLDKGLTQTELGKQIGVSFQQVQKYEMGRNRVGGGRLFKISDTLRVPISAFFQDAEILHQSDQMSLLSMLTEPNALALLKAFRQIRDTETRRLLVHIMEFLGAGYCSR
jgi:transcriptional regulator with XRE-family HTH domain